MRFGLTICNHGRYADPTLLCDLAVAAEAAGWDGFFVWDHIARDGEPPMTDPWITLAAVAARTDRIILGPMVTPIARRRPQKLAREVVALDHLSGGRLVLGIGLGVHDEEFGMMGEAATPRARASLLDEGLEVLTGLLSGDRIHHHGEHHDIEAVFQPGPVRGPAPDRRHGIPIWLGGTWPNSAPFRRAARYDGTFPAGPDTYAPEDYRALRAFVDQHRGDAGPFTVVHQSTAMGAEQGQWSRYAEARVDWWLESVRSETSTVEATRAMIAAGPPPRV